MAGSPASTGTGALATLSAAELAAHLQSRATPPASYLCRSCQDAEKRSPNLPKQPSIPVHFTLLLYKTLWQDCEFFARPYSVSLVQGTASFFCKGQMYILHLACYTLWLNNKQAWLCPNKTFCTKTSCRTGWVCRL